MVKFDDLGGRYYRTKIEGRRIWKLDLPSWIDSDDWAGELILENHMRIPKFRLVDPASLLCVVEEARTAVGG